MRLLEVLKEYPAGKDFLKRREPALKRIQALREEVTRRHAEYTQALEQWDVNSRKDVEAGKMPDPMPTPLDPAAEGQVIQHIRAEEQRLHDEETDVVCSLAAEIKVWLWEREADRKARLRPHVAALEEEAREAAADLGMLSEVLAQEQKRMTAIPRPSPLERLVTTVTPERLLTAMQYDTSLMDLEPLTHKRSPFDSEPSPLEWSQTKDGVRLGLSRPGEGTFGARDDWPREPVRRGNPLP